MICFEVLHPKWVSVRSASSMMMCVCCVVFCFCVSTEVDRICERGCLSKIQILRRNQYIQILFVDFSCQW